MDKDIRQIARCSRMFVDYIATKQMIAPALNTFV